MKKTFPLHAPGREDRRVLEAIKTEIVRYLKRERRKALPEGGDFWGFDCRVGKGREEAVKVRASEVGTAVDAVAGEGAGEVYVEILAFAGRRARSGGEDAGESAGESAGGVEP